MPIQVEPPSANTMTSVYDAIGQLTTSTDSADNETAYTYDVRGRRTVTTYANGLQDVNVYDNAGQVIRTIKVLAGTWPGSVTASETQVMSYDANGNRSSYTDGNGKSWIYAYDAANRLMSTRTPLFTPTTPTRSDLDDELRQLGLGQATAATQLTLAVADSIAGAVVGLTPPAGGTRTLQATREYDAAGRLIARTDYNGSRIVQTYNKDGQLASIEYPNGKKITYDWTCCRLASMTDQYGISRFTYDIGNRLVSSVDATGHQVTYTYWTDGRRDSMYMPGQSFVGWQYTKLGSIEKIILPTFNEVDFQYDAARRMTYYNAGSQEIASTWQPTYLASSILSGIFEENYTPVETTMPGRSPLNVSGEWEATSGLVTFGDILTIRADMKPTSKDLARGSTDLLNDYTYDAASAIWAFSSL